MTNCSTSSEQEFQSQIIIQSFSLFFSFVTTLLGMFGIFKWTKSQNAKTTSATDDANIVCDEFSYNPSSGGISFKGLKIIVQERDTGTSVHFSQSVALASKDAVSRPSAPASSSNQDGARVVQIDANFPRTDTAGDMSEMTRVSPMHQNHARALRPSETHIVSTIHSALLQLAQQVRDSAVTSITNNSNRDRDSRDRDARESNEPIDISTTDSARPVTGLDAAIFDTAEHNS